MELALALLKVENLDKNQNLDKKSKFQCKQRIPPKKALPKNFSQNIPPKKFRIKKIPPEKFAKISKKFPKNPNNFSKNS